MRCRWGRLYHRKKPNRARCVWFISRGLKVEVPATFFIEKKYDFCPEKLFLRLEKSPLTLEKFFSGVEKFISWLEKFALSREKQSLALEKFPLHLEKFALHVEKLSLTLEKLPSPVEKSVWRPEILFSALLRD